MLPPHTSSSTAAAAAAYCSSTHTAAAKRGGLSRTANQPNSDAHARTEVANLGYARSVILFKRLVLFQVRQRHPRLLGRPPFPSWARRRRRNRWRRCSGSWLGLTASRINLHPPLLLVLPFTCLLPCDAACCSRASRAAASGGSSAPISAPTAPAACARSPASPSCCCRRSCPPALAGVAAC